MHAGQLVEMEDRGHSQQIKLNNLNVSLLGQEKGIIFIQFQLPLILVPSPTCPEGQSEFKFLLNYAVSSWFFPSSPDVSIQDATLPPCPLPTAPFGYTLGTYPHLSDPK